MKVAIVSSTFPEEKPGGVPTYVEGRMAVLSRRCEVRLFALGQGDGVDRIGIGRSASFRRNVLIVWFRLLSAIREYRPDVIEVHNIPVGLPLFVLARRVNYFFHGPARLEARLEGIRGTSLAIKYLLEWVSIRCSRRVLVASSAFRALVCDEHPYLRARVRPPVIRYPKFVASPVASADAEDDRRCLEEIGLRFPGPRPVFVSVRRLVARTGLELLVRSFDRALTDGLVPQDAVLLIVGGGPLHDQIERLIRELGRQDNIRLVGRVSDQARDALYRHAHFNVVPTVGLEGFGLVVVEAALHGCPSIVTNVNALPEVVALLDGCGLVCEPDEGAMAAALGSSLKACRVDRAALQRLAVNRFVVRGRGPR